MIDLPTAFDVFADRMIRVVVFDVQRYLVAAGLFTIALLVFRSWARRKRIQGRQATRKDYTREIAEQACGEGFEWPRRLQGSGKGSQ